MSVEVAQFRQAYEKSLASDNPLLQQVAEHLLARRGKQLRPMLVLLSAKMCRGVNESTPPPLCMTTWWTTRPCVAA